MDYLVQEHLKPKGLKGISDDQIEEHWSLYRGYVQSVNGLMEELGRAEAGSRHWTELKRRAGFEFDGMVLHEYYFGNLKAGIEMDRQGALARALAQAWDGRWQHDFVATGTMRGIGWAILYHDPLADRLFNWWISEHEVNHPAGLSPILVLDVFEHAYMVDHGAGGRAQYVAAFLDNVNWRTVEQRFSESRGRRVPNRFAITA
jgi:Fe-Mn family superoxide dismutase